MSNSHDESTSQMINKKILPLFLFILFLAIQQLQATHIRAGEIIVKRISNSTPTYLFKIIGYTDTGSEVLFGGGEIDFGDGVKKDLTGEGINTKTITLEDEVDYVYFEIKHTFQGPGRYTVRYNESNRNDGVRNMSNSVNTPFYVESDVSIDPFIGLNNSPIFLIPPIDHGAEGATFLHNPGAYDSDGDSLSFRLTKPKQFYDKVVNDYKAPNDAGFYEDFLHGNQEGDGRPIFRIDSISGLMTWDAPGILGEYNVAFVVDEWRKIDNRWFNIGSVTRDMQIIIEKTDNEPPVLTMPLDACVLAGEMFTTNFDAIDPDGDEVEIEAFGAPFEFGNSPATFSPSPVIFQPSPGQLRFDWNTNCSHVRLRPYEVNVKVRDKPVRTLSNGSSFVDVKLVDFKTWYITVVAPPPTGLTTSLLTKRQVKLAWDSYKCGTADSIQVWRRVDSNDFEVGDCVIGMPANAGYMLIDRVNINPLKGNVINEYIDDANGLGLAPGAKYCYRLVASFPQPGGGLSYVSTESCVQIDVIAPVMLNVDVTKTNASNGEIYLRWEEPFDLPVQFERPFYYDLLRINGTDTLSVSFSQNKEFTDTQLNTENISYRYIVNAHEANVDPANRKTDGSFIDFSFPASSVWLSASSGVDVINLSWKADVPWSNIVVDYPLHDVFRAVEDGFGGLVFEKIGEADVTMTGLSFSDDGSYNDEPLDEKLIYNYYVETKGSYGNPLLDAYDPLLNKSQVIKAQSNDLEPPCTPVTFRVKDGFDCVSFLADRLCSFEDYSVTLDWSQDGASICDNDIMSYNIYYSQDDNTVELPFFKNVQGTTFTHDKTKQSFKGYYQIAAVDRSGNVSDRSEILTIDNCPNIAMPNAFSPNGDGINDNFSPYDTELFRGEGEGTTKTLVFDLALCSRFVKAVQFKVFDRTGGELYFFDSEGRLNNEQGNASTFRWDGRNKFGRELPPDTYFYSLKVKFDVLNPDLQEKTYKGWVQIVK